MNRTEHSGEDDDMQVGRRKAEERRQLVELYENRGSGVTKEVFCRIHRVASSTLDYWRQMERRKGPGKLVAVKLQPTSLGSDSAPSGFALCLTNGRRIETSWRFGDADLARLIRIAESV